MDRASRTARNSLASVAAFGVTALVVAVTTPILVHHLGREGYGIYSLASTLTTFLALLDFGLGTGLIKLIAERAARRDADAVNAVVGSTLTVYFGVGAVGMLVAAALGLFFARSVFNLTPSAVDVAAFAFVVAGATYFFTLLTKPFSSTMLAVQRNVAASAVQSTCVAAVAVASVVLVYSGYGVRAVVAAGAVGAACNLLLAYAVAKRIVPTLAVRLGWDRALLRTMLGFSGWIFLAHTSAFFLFQLDRVLIGTLASVRVVTYYAVAGSLASYLYVAIAALGSITIAASTELFAQGDSERARRLYVRATRFVVPSVLGVGIPVAIFARVLCRYWIDADFARHSTTPLRLLLLTYVILALNVIPYNVIVGAGRPRVLAFLNLGMLVLNVVLLVILVPPYGIVGAAVAYLISVLPILGFIWYAERAVVDLRGVWLPIVLRNAPAAAVATAVGFALVPHAHNLGEVVAYIAVCAAAYAAVYLPTAAKEDRVLIRALLQRGS